MTVLHSVWSGRDWLLCSASPRAITWAGGWHDDPAFREAVFRVCGTMASLQLDMRRHVSLLMTRRRGGAVRVSQA